MKWVTILSNDNKVLDNFELSVNQVDHERRIKVLEDDMKQIKPIVYDTQRSVNQIEKSVNKVAEDLSQIKKSNDDFKIYIIKTGIGMVVTVVTGILIAALMMFFKH